MRSLVHGRQIRPSYCLLVISEKKAEVLLESARLTSLQGPGPAMTSSIIAGITSPPFGLQLHWEGLLNMTRKRGEYTIEHVREAFEDSKTVRGI